MNWTTYKLPLHSKWSNVQQTFPGQVLTSHVKRKNKQTNKAKQNKTKTNKQKTNKQTTNKQTNKTKQNKKKVSVFVNVKLVGKLIDNLNWVVTFYIRLTLVDI